MPGCQGGTHGISVHVLAQIETHTSEEFRVYSVDVGDVLLEEFGELVNRIARSQRGGFRAHDVDPVTVHSHLNVERTLTGVGSQCDRASVSKFSS